jgi:hypothetical protein
VAARDSCGSPSDRGNRARQRGANLLTGDSRRTSHVRRCDPITWHFA